MSLLLLILLILLSARETDPADGPAWRIDAAGDFVLDPEGGGWLAGMVRCAACGHRWVAVRPVATRDLECPACHRSTTVTEED